MAKTKKQWAENGGTVSTKAVERIVGRIRRMEMGNTGDSRSVGHGILEMRIDYGLRYRTY